MPVVERNAISPGVWLSFALGALAFAIGKSALSDYFHPIGVTVIFWILIAAVSLFMATREFYIREGIRLATTDATDTSRQTPMKRLALPNTTGELPTITKSNIRFLETRNAPISFSEGSFIHAPGPYAAITGIGLLAVFINEPLKDRPVMGIEGVKARATLTSAKGRVINVAAGWWFGGTVAHTAFPAGDARELLLVATKPNEAWAVDARKVSTTDATPLYTVLDEESYEIAVTLTLGPIQIGEFDFHLEFKPHPKLSVAHRLRTS